MADRVPLPRVSTAYAAATAAPAAEAGVVPSSNDGKAHSTSSAPTTSTSTSTNPLDAPVARAALLTMASELTVLDILGFLSGPVSGKDFSASYRTALESLASPNPPPNAGASLVSALRACAGDALVALFASGEKGEADAVSRLLDVANARVSQALLLAASSSSPQQQPAQNGGAETKTEPAAFAAVETTGAGLWKASGEQQQLPTELLALRAARGPANLKARPGADRAAARSDASLGVAPPSSIYPDPVAASASGGGEDGVAGVGGIGAGRGGGGRGKGKGGKGGKRGGTSSASTAALPGAVRKAASNLPSPSDLPPILAYELAFMLESAVAPTMPEEEEAAMAPATTTEAGGDEPTAAAAITTTAPPLDQQAPAPKGAHRVRQACRARVSALRATRAAEVARVLDVDASGVAAALRTGRYSDVEVLCADVAAIIKRAAEASAEALVASAADAAESAASAKANDAEEASSSARGVRARGGATTMRKGKLVGLADQFSMALTSAMAEVAMDFGAAERKKAKRGAGRSGARLGAATTRASARGGGAGGRGDEGGDGATAAPAFDENGNPIPPTSPSALSPRRPRGPMPEAILANREPYLHGAWRRRPYAPRPYERLKAYKVNPMSKYLIDWKLTTEKKGQCDGSGCVVPPGQLGTYSLEMEAFDTRCGCLKNNLECGPNCGCATVAKAKNQLSEDPKSTEFPPACANRAVTRRETLRRGVDVKEVNAWGMDCYSRRNIVDAVLESQAFGSYSKPDYRALAAEAEVQAAALARGEKIHRPDAEEEGENNKKDEDDPSSPASRPGSAALLARCCTQSTRDRASDWVERVLHPAITAQGAQGWDLARALKSIVELQQKPGEKEATKKEEKEASATKDDGGEKKEAPKSTTTDDLEAAAALATSTAAAARAAAAAVPAGEEREAFLTASSVDASSLASAAAAAAVALRLEVVGDDYFRVHPKGVGMQVIRPGGIPRLTFVEEYLGEVHAPWRWFELQDALKKVTGGELPDFYNIVLERPRDDPDGYDALFVDAASRGAFASRMSHSCTPNCQAVVMACGGRLTIAVYTLRHVHVGEELTFDYASVTESEKEFRDAICLCGTSGCRGSFLTYSGSRAFQAVMNEKHNVLHRQAIILHAGDSPGLTEKDRSVLDRFGVRDAALGRRVDSGKTTDPDERVPAWLEKWAALILHYVERERELLPEALLALPPALGGGYSRSSAALEARGVADSRLQNVVITVDKVKYVLSQSPREVARDRSPLRRLTDEEAAEHIWNGPRSIARRLLRAASPSLSTPQVARGVASAVSSADVRRALEKAGVGPGVGHHPQLHELAEAVLREPPAATFEEARQRLFGLVPMLRKFDAESRGGHTAAADVATFYATTRVWFKAERGFASFTSPAVRLAPSDLCVIGDGGGAAAAAGGGAAAITGPAKKKQKVAKKKKAAAASTASTSKSASPSVAAKEGEEAAPAASGGGEAAAVTTTAAPATTSDLASASAAAARPATPGGAGAATTPAEAAAATAGHETTTTAAPAAPEEAAAEQQQPAAPPSGPQNDLLPLPEGAECDPVPPHLPPADEDGEGLIDEATAARAGLAKKYGPWFIWGQLSGWFKQTVYDPTASLSAERRGTISLPDVESCYGGCARSRYQARDRNATLEHIASRPDAMWKVGTLWSFKNEGKIYGSPCFDSRWAELTGEFDDPVPAMLRDLRGAWVPYGSGSCAAGKGTKAAAAKAATASAPASAAPATSAPPVATAMEVDAGGASAAGAEETKYEGEEPATTTTAGD